MIIASAVVLAATVTAVLLLRRGLVIVTITGSSMEPTYRPGARVLARRHRLHNLRRGDVVLLSYDRPLATLRPGDAVPPPSGRLVKRVVAVPGDTVPADGLLAAARTSDGLVPPQCYVVRGDNPRVSADSRVFGYVPAANVLAVAIRHITR